MKIFVLSNEMKELMPSAYANTDAFFAYPISGGAKIEPYLMISEKIARNERRLSEILADQGVKKFL